MHFQPRNSYYNLAMSGLARKKLGNGGVVPPGYNEDYMNQHPEGVSHVYSNQKELLEQVSQL